MISFPTRWAFAGLVCAVWTGLVQCSASSANHGEAPDAKAGVGDGGGYTRDTGRERDTGAGPDTEGGVDGGLDAPMPQQQLGTPTCTPPGPATLVPGSTITLEAPASDPADVQIFFSLDGTVPVPTSSSLYGGPIQIDFATGARATVTAIAHDPAGDYVDSVPATCVYEDSEPCCGVFPPVIFSQQSSTQNNDFLLGLSDLPGATICYSVDGVTVPTCTAAGNCVSPALTYNQVLQINGGVPPNPATGSVTVTAIGCAPGEGSTQAVSQTFILQVGAPTMSLGGHVVPPTTGVSNAPWPTGTAGLAPTVQSETHDSIVVTDPVVLRYAFGTATPPTCADSGVGLPNPTTFGSAIAPAVAPVQSASQTYQVIACKQGYLPSPVVTFPVSMQLNAPALPSAASPDYDDFDLSDVPGAAGTGIDDSANAGAPGEILCATTDGTPATCSVGAGGALGCGGTGSSPASLLIQKTGTTVNVVACGPGLTPSPPGTVTYTLQLAPPFLSSTDPAGNALGGPGWNWASTGAPVLVMSLPLAASTAAPGYPYADGFTWNVGQIQDQATPCTGPAGPEPTGGCGPAVYFAPDYYCWSLTKTAACGPGGTCTSGTLQAVTAAGNPAAALPASAGVTPGTTLSLVACDADVAGEAVFAPSAPTNISFQ